MSVVIIDYGSGNLRSAAKAFERASREAGSDIGIKVSARTGDVRAASRVVLPGVGAFADCKHGLESLPGMREALEDVVIRRAVPFLGICVGMQLMARRGYEHGTHDGLGWLDAEVMPIAASDTRLKIPHMGWNDLNIDKAHPILKGIATGEHAYFVHSYAIRCRAPGDVLAHVDYGGPVSAVVGRDNMVGTQFHPEKSQVTGLRLITNFLTWRPT
jgi:glutamine amidotransferase